MKSYRELQVWQESYKLTLEIYKLSEKFPKEEMYGLTSQMRRSALSVPANISEGFNRRTKKEYLQFLYISRGSLQEVDFLVLLSKDLGYIKKTDFLSLKERIDLIGRLLSGLINSIKKK